MKGLSRKKIQEHQGTRKFQDKEVKRLSSYRLNDPHHSSNPSPEFLNSLRLLKNSSLSRKGRGNCFVANHSSVQLFNLSTHFTLHPSLFTYQPLTRISKFATLIKKFFPLPQGARELFCSKSFIRSTFQPFNSPHPSPFTLHFSDPSPEQGERGLFYVKDLSS